MHLVRRACALLSTVVLATTLLAGSPSAASSPSDRSSAPTPRALSGQAVLDWERISFRTVYTDGATPIPVGVPVLGFTSLAMHEAAQTSRHRGRSSERAALVAAAHRVLLHYYPAAAAKLDADRARSLASVPAGPPRAKGIRIGTRVAGKLLADRVGDGYLDPDVHYTLPPRPGVWQPTPPATDMLAAWLGSLRPLLVTKPVAVGGPDPLTSPEYAAQFEQVKSLGRVDSSTRGEARTQTALFFNSNSATMVGDALIRYLEEHPMRLGATARLFAAIHVGMTDTVIQCWRLKRDVGFWRPQEAIVNAELDGNDATTDDDAWRSLVPNPPYADYVSGHGCLTSPAIGVIRKTLGDGTPLELISVNSPTPRIYPSLRHLEAAASNSRIWAGLHFRTAMTDAYRIGHVTARRVMRAMD